MRVLFVIRSLDVGGAERQLVELAKGLALAGHQPGVAVFYAGGSLESELTEAGVPVFSLRKSGRWDLRFVARLVRLVRHFRPDVLHSYLGTSNQVAALLRPLLGGIPVVWGVRSAFMDLARFGWLSRLGYRVDPLLSGVPDAIIVNSEAGREHAVRAGYRDRGIRVVANGIDCQRFSPDRSGRASWRGRWGASAEQLVAGVVGRLDPMKDHPTFLRAAGDVSTRVPQALFACVGGGDPAYRARLETVARESGLEDRLRWEAGTGDVRGVYSALDFLVLSSYGESFPNVVAEAMACGTPCVVTNVGDAAKIVADTGIVVPASNTAALAQGMESMFRLASAERADMGARARRRVQDLYSVEVLVRNTVEVFATVLRDGAPGRGIAP